MTNYDICIYIVYEKMDLDFDDGIITNKITTDEILNFCEEIRKPVNFTGFLIYLFHDKKHSTFTMKSEAASQAITCESNIKSNITALENIREKLKSCEDHKKYVKAIWEELNFYSSNFNSSMFDIFVIPKDLKFDNIMICNNKNNYGLKLIDLDDAYFYINDKSTSNSDLFRLQNMYLQDLFSPCINILLKKIPLYKQPYIDFLNSCYKLSNDIDIINNDINKQEKLSIIEQKINSLKNNMKYYDDANKLVYFFNVLCDLSNKMQNKYNDNTFGDCLKFMFNMFFNNFDDNIITIFIKNAKKINQIKINFDNMLNLFNA